MGAIGSCWAQPSWADNVWADRTWAGLSGQVNGTFSVSAPAPAFVGAGLARHYGGVKTGIFDAPRRLTPATGDLYVATWPNARFSATGWIAAPATGAFRIRHPLAAVRLRGTVDDITIFEEEALLLDFLMEDD